MKLTKNIIYIVHNYTSFQKDNIEELAKSFNKVFVFVRYKPISKVAKFFPFGWLNKFSNEKVIDTFGVPENVYLIRTTVWYLPFSFFYKLVGFFHFKAVDKAIIKNNIKFDLIHAHFLWSSGYVAMKLKQKYNIPFIVTGHGYDVYKLPQSNEFLKKKIKEILHSSDKIITVSNKNKLILKQLGIQDEKILVIFNGYNPNLFFKKNKNQSRNELNIDSSQKIILTIGNLEIIKGYQYLITAIKDLSGNYPIHLFMVGAGSQERRLKNLVNKYRLNNQITFLGHLPHSNLNDWMNACDVFVLSSLNEGLPTVILEALGCGKPVVSTNVGGIPEIIHNEKYGILVEKENPIDFSKAIIQSFEKKWDENMIRDYGNRFTVSQNAKKLLEVYRSLFENE